MPYEDRKKLMKHIETIRKGRKLVAICNFDRISQPALPGVITALDVEIKGCLYRVLKESNVAKGIDIFLYTRGGDTNAVWPITSLIREFDPDFEILVPFRAHSAGTMIALAARKIFMTRIGELSPIDPSTGNQFNPLDDLKPGNRLGISVEDLNAYKDFVKETFNFNKTQMNIEQKRIFDIHIQKLTERVHPLAIGNVHRVHKLTQKLAYKLLKCHRRKGQDRIENIIDKITVAPYSHLHMFNREEATEILGKDHVVKADEPLETALDSLLRQYENDFHLRNPLFITRLMDETQATMEFRFAGGVVESIKWGYLFETKGKIFQFSKVPNNVTVQLPPGQAMPLIPGLPREYRIEVLEQKWHHNIKPEGITI